MDKTKVSKQMNSSVTHLENFQAQILKDLKKADTNRK